MPDYSKYRLSPDAITICSYCGRVLKDGKLGVPVSHGICPGCKEKLIQQYEKETGEEVLRDGKRV